MPTRQEVYEAIDSERDYQVARWGNTVTKGQHSITEFIAYMEDYLAEAKHILARKGKAESYPLVLPIMRKVTTLGVACMEQNGAQKRDEDAK